MRTWMCPFFTGAEGKRVNCEGVKMSFKNAAARNSYISKHCANAPGWETCPIAKQLLIAYEKDDEA